METKSHLKILTNEDTLCLMTFLVDVLVIFNRYQQTIQSNRVSVWDLVEHTKSLVDKLQSLSSINLVGGRTWKLMYAVETLYESG